MPAGPPADVKTEIEDAADANKTQDADEELPDFGGDEETKAEGQEAEHGVAGLQPEAKEEPDERAKGEPRPDAILVSGVQRLTRKHLAEVFASKRLPNFQRVEWIADDKCMCIFADAQATSKSLSSCLEGFEAGAHPGPGLWRASRGMIEFRQATVLDVPSANFKRQHRAGRQVRDYRFWEAAKDIDKGILDSLEQQGTKRPAPSGEDAIAAAVPADQLEAPRKRRKVQVEEEEVPDILQQMAQKDKEIMALKEEVQEPAASGEAEAVAAVSDVVPQEKWEDSWFAQQAKTAGRRTEAWGRHAQADDLQPREDFDRRKEPGERRRDVRRGDRDWRHDQFHEMLDRGPGWGHDDRRDEGRARKRRGEAHHRGTEPATGQPGPASGSVWEADENERRKRQKRMDRFSKAAPAAATDTAGDQDR
ncbi:unnamed protein product [Effrenium voratum]|uniref:Uncharacterized protein n=1 Tax=Effrenium voratum TaxID=2562239 RepID=A0AA36JT37_9DINO|nr:unnamed protein product [Effrenium voratum]CAJ1425726.1 unnamed protein product [Effrenium voratum]